MKSHASERGAADAPVGGGVQSDQLDELRNPVADAFVRLRDMQNGDRSDAGNQPVMLQLQGDSAARAHVSG